MIDRPKPGDPHEHSGHAGPERGPHSQSARDERAAMEAGGAPTRPGVYGSALLAIAVIAAGCSIFLYNWLSQWRWPVSVTASAMAQANSVLLPDLLLTGDGGQSVRWDIADGYVRQLTVTGAAQGTAQVIVPLPR